MQKENWDTEWLYFSKKARRGIFILLAVFSMIAVIPRLYYNFISKSEEYELIVTQLQSRTVTPESSNDKNQSALFDDQFKIPNNKFNPNAYTLDDWEEFGFTERQAKTIVNYRNKYGDFKVKSDVKKLFVVSDTLYNEIAVFIDLPEYLEPKAKSNKQQKEYIEPSVVNAVELEADNEIVVEINSATEKELQKVKGIGPFFSREIIKMRNLLGGIVEMEQLLDIYNMDDEVLQELMPFLRIDKSKVKQINLNTASKEQMVKHPWINSDMANSFIYIRENYRPFNSVEDILLSPYADQKVLKKLRPYLTVGKYDE